MGEQQKLKASFRKILFINFIIMAALLIAVTMIGECWLRLFIPSIDHAGLMKFTSTPITYEMLPNMKIEREGVEIRTNSNGFRDTDFSGEPKPGQFLIAVLGDSFTFGQGVAQSRAFPVILQTLLNGSSNGGKFRVWNLGVQGYNTEQENYVLQSFVLPRKPDWVVVGYNFNDWEPIAVNPNLVEQESSQHKHFTEYIKKFVLDDLLITQFVKQRLGNLIRIFKPNWYASSYIQDNLDQYLKPDGGWSRVVSRLLQHMEADCQSKGIGFTVAVLPGMFDFKNYPFEPMNEVVINFCKKNGIDYVDILPYFRSKNFMKCWVSSMDPHPNAAAQKVFAEAIADHLEKKFSTKSKYMRTLF